MTGSPGNAGSKGPGRAQKKKRDVPPIAVTLSGRASNARQRRPASLSGVKYGVSFMGFVSFLENFKAFEAKTKKITQNLPCAETTNTVRYPGIQHHS